MRRSGPARKPSSSRWEGNYRAEHLITLGQSLEGYRFLQQMMADVDMEIEKFMDALPAKIDLNEHPCRRTGKKQKRQHNAPAYDLRQYCYRAFGVDVTAIPGIAGTTAQVLLTEVGPDLSKFRSASAFASWLTVCPHNDISGGKILKARTRKGSNRAALALRLAAQTLENGKHHLGEFFRRMRSKLGRAQAITAVAHKLARIFYTLITTGKDYDESILAAADVRQKTDRKPAFANAAATSDFRSFSRLIKYPNRAFPCLPALRFIRRRQEVRQGKAEFRIAGEGVISKSKRESDRTPP